MRVMRIAAMFRVGVVQRLPGLTRLVPVRIGKWRGHLWRFVTVAVHQWYQPAQAAHPFQVVLRPLLRL